jgi:small-conductance mechanosensitive channel
MTLTAPATQAPEELTSALEVFQRISIWKVLAALLVLAAAYLAVRAVTAGLEAIGRRVPRARLFFNNLGPVVRFLVWIVASVAIVAVFAPSREALLGMAASVGIALGLGAQDLVKNLIGGLVILTDRPYQLGDRVKIGDAYGEIDHIGLRSTKLTTTDDTRVTIPNSAILSGMAWNANSGALDCQVVTELFVPHDSDPVEVLAVAREAAYSSPYVLLSKPVAIRLEDRFTEQPYLAVRVKAYVYDHRHERAFMTDVTARAKTAFLRRGILAAWSRDHPA